MSMTDARSLMHIKHCRDTRCVIEVDEPGDRCKSMDFLIDRIEVEHTQAAARKLLDMHYETVLTHGAAVGQGLALAYKTVAPDPYYKEPQP